MNGKIKLNKIKNEKKEKKKKNHTWVWFSLLRGFLAFEVWMCIKLLHKKSEVTLWCIVKINVWIFWNYKNNPTFSFNKLEHCLYSLLRYNKFKYLRKNRKWKNKTEETWGRIDSTMHTRKVVNKELNNEKIVPMILIKCFTSMQRASMVPLHRLYSQ